MEQPISAESRQILYKRMGEVININSKILQECIPLQEVLKNMKPNKNTEICIAFISLYIYVLYMSIEIASILRASFRTEILSEKRYHLKLINGLILESYKHLYGYKTLQKKSLWISKIQPLITVIKDPQFKSDYEKLTEIIQSFGEDKITDQERRNIAFHYDEEPSIVYEMLMNLSEETEAQRINKFLSLQEDLSSFICKYIYKLGGKKPKVQNAIC